MLTGAYICAIIRNGYLAQRTIQTCIGDVEIKVPNVMGISVATKYASIAYCYPLI
ncbi:MAG: hypothetical protein ACTS73_03475 [Arsenophonus sp. NEOnobi-MAG3]